MSIYAGVTTSVWPHLGINIHLKKQLVKEAFHVGVTLDSLGEFCDGLVIPRLSTVWTGSNTSFPRLGLGHLHLDEGLVDLRVAG